MEKYIIRDIRRDDYKQVVAVYNSNRRFLLNHLGVESVDEAFVSGEVSVMHNAGFNSCVIVNGEKQEIQGVLDFKSGNKEIYLSLLMLPAYSQDKGIGRDVYACFESKMKQLGSTSIRIDVVNDYDDNAVPFWKKLGFVECETVTLEWGNKKSTAIVMRKNIQ